MVAYQSDRGLNFGDGQTWFSYSPRFLIVSDSIPSTRSLWTGSGYFYVRGSQFKHDWDIMHLRNVKLRRKLAIMVKAYNKKWA